MDSLFTLMKAFLSFMTIWIGFRPPWPRFDKLRKCSCLSPYNENIFIFTRVKSLQHKSNENSYQLVQQTQTSQGQKEGDGWGLNIIQCTNNISTVHLQHLCFLWVRHRRPIMLVPPRHDNRLHFLTLQMLSRRTLKPSKIFHYVY